MAVDTSIFITPVNTREIMEKLKSKSTQIQSTYSEQMEKGQIRDPKLETAYQDVEELRDTLQRGETKLFKMGMYFTIHANTLEDLDKASNLLEDTLGGMLIYTKPASLQQESCFNSTLPICLDEMEINRNFDTLSASTSFPFVSNELSDNDGILYGINLHTNGFVIFDRFTLENANSVILAKSGSGKSYFVKLEALRSLMMGAEVIVIDPENEYERLCSAIGGSYLDISLNSDKRINPFDLPQRKTIKPIEDDGEDVLRSNVVMMSGLLKLIFSSSKTVGGEGTLMAGITPEEDNLLDRAIVEAYAARGITTDPKTHALAPPTMSDLQKTLQSINGAERMAQMLGKYTEGTFSGIFDQQTNLELDNPFIVFCIKNLEDALRPIAMHMVLDFIWNRVKSDRKKRILVVDEAWIMMKEKDESAQFLYSMAKRARKYYLGVTTITQDVEDFLHSSYGKAIINNSSLTFLMKQHPATIDLVSHVFNLTQAEKYFLLNSDVGEGLFFAGLNHVAISVASSYQEELLITTDPEHLNQIEQLENLEEGGV